jgi:hypothetical protein
MIPARHNLAALRRLAAPGYQIRALLAGAPIIRERVRLR